MSQPTTATAAAAAPTKPKNTYWEGCFTGFKSKPASKTTKNDSKEKKESKDVPFVEGCVYVKHSIVNNTAEIFVMHEKKPFKDVHIVLDLPVKESKDSQSVTLPNIEGSYLGTSINFQVQHEDGKKTSGVWKTSHDSFSVANLSGTFNVSQTTLENMQPFKSKGLHKLALHACTIS